MRGGGKVRFAFRERMLESLWRKNFQESEKEGVMRV
jgi:hypothetical protein